MPLETRNLPLITREASPRLVRGKGNDMTIDVIWTTGASAAFSEACGGEVGASLVAGGLALAQGAVNFVAGYLVMEQNHNCQ